MEFPPTDSIRPLPVPEGLADALGTAVLETWQGRRDLLCVVSDSATLQSLTPPDLTALRQVGRPVIVTAPPGEGEHRLCVALLRAHSGGSPPRIRSPGPRTPR